MSAGASAVCPTDVYNVYLVCQVCWALLAASHLVEHCFGLCDSRGRLPSASAPKIPVHSDLSEHPSPALHRNKTAKGFTAMPVLGGTSGASCAALSAPA